MATPPGEEVTAKLTACRLGAGDHRPWSVIVLSTAASVSTAGGAPDAGAGAVDLMAESVGHHVEQGIAAAIVACIATTTCTGAEQGQNGTGGQRLHRQPVNLRIAQCVTHADPPYDGPA